MRTFVTGGAGFVASHLSTVLAAAGHEVSTSDRASGGPDLTDRDGVHQAIAAASPDIIFHLGGQSHVPTSWTDPIGTLRANVEGTQNVLDAAFDCDVGRVLVVTSAEVYGKVTEADLPVDEEHPLRPVNPYAASKVAADTLALQSHLGRGQDVIRLRAFNHIGPGQKPSFVAAGLAERIAQAERSGAAEIAVGNQTSRRDFTDVRDVAQAYLDVATSGVSGEAYNVCSGVDRSIGEIAAGLLAHSTASVALTTDPELERPVDVPVVRGDHSKLSTHTGWRPQIALADSLGDILADARARL